MGIAESCTHFFYCLFHARGLAEILFTEYMKVLQMESCDEISLH
jgi:hypothetical protein